MVWARAEASVPPWRLGVPNSSQVECRADGEIAGDRRGLIRPDATHFDLVTVLVIEP